MKGYRTIVFNVIMALLAFVRLIDPTLVVPSDVDVNTALAAVDTAMSFVLIVGNLILRAVTNTKIGKKTE